MSQRVQPTLATMILMIIFAVPLFTYLISSFVQITTTTWETIKNDTPVLNDTKPPGWVSKMKEYREYQHSRSLLVGILRFLASVLTNKLIVAGLIAIGAIYVAIEIIYGYRYGL